MAASSHGGLAMLIFLFSDLGGKEYAAVELEAIFLYATRQARNNRDAIIRISLRYFS
jgi:hypothetical protein